MLQSQRSEYRPARPVRKLTGFPYSRLVTDKSENMTGAILDTHRQIRRLVYTPLVRIESEVSTTEEISYGTTGASC